MRTCNHTEYLFRFWGKYLLDQSILKKTRTHQQNSGNVQEHEKFPLERFPTCCINKGRVCWSSSPTHFIFWERNMLSLRNEAWLKHPHPFHPEFWCMCVYVCFFPFYIHQISLELSHSSYPSTKDFQQRAAGAPYWLVSPGSAGFHRKSMAAYFPLHCGFMCGLTWPQLYTDPFCRAISIQMCPFTNSGN